jgi:hypothetical protein
MIDIFKFIINGFLCKYNKLAKRHWLSFLRMQESIDYIIITELVFRRMSGKSKFYDFLRFCQIYIIALEI